MARRPYREWGSCAILYPDTALLDQMSKWKTQALHVAGFYGHQIVLAPYKVHDMDAKMVAVDPTLMIGRCATCHGSILVCSSLKNGVKYYRIRKKCKPCGPRIHETRCRAMQQRLLRESTEICKRRGGVPVLPRNFADKDRRVIRDLAERMLSRAPRERVFR